MCAAPVAARPLSSLSCSLALSLSRCFSLALSPPLLSRIPGYGAEAKKFATRSLSRQMSPIHDGVDIDELMRDSEVRVLIEPKLTAAEFK